MIAFKLILHSALFIAINLQIVNCENNYYVSDQSNEGKFTIIETNNGAIRGLQLTTLFNNRTYHSFKGVPYAKPPVGELRFQVPKPVDSWHPRILNVLKYEKACLQPNYLQRDNFEQGEDCLHLNIFTPNVTSTAKLPVMFYIHGGKFCTDSSDDFMFGPDFLMEKNVVLVTLNYRLGIFGCLSLGTPEYSGNMGHKDQRLGLKWVIQNIGQFGGDNKKITIFGHSTGAGSVHLHMLSPWSRDLFQRAIIMSGSALSAWSYTSLENHLEQTFNFVNRMNKSASSYDDLLHLLKSIPAQELLDNTLDQPMGSIWAPIIEDPNATEPFLTKTPEQLLETYKTNIDSMFGFVTEEMLFSIFDEANITQFLEKANKEIDFAAAFRENPLKSDKRAYRSLTKEVKDFYFGPEVEINHDTLHEYSDFLSDATFVYHLDKAVKLQANKSIGRTYYYRFSVDLKLNQIKNYYNLTMPTTVHADELCYLFRCHRKEISYDNITEDSLEYKVIENMSKLWTNFAKYGKPLPDDDPVQFRPVKNNFTYFMDITNTGMFPGFEPHRKHLEFWKNFDKKYHDLVNNLNNQREKSNKNLNY